MALCYPCNCDSISQCIVLIKSVDKKGTTRVVSQMYHVLLPLWFRRSHTRNLNTLIYKASKLSSERTRASDGWELPCYRCVAAPLFVQILPVVLGYRTNTTLTGSWEEMSRVSPWWQSAGTASPVANDVSHQPGLSLPAPHALDCKAGAVAQWGIEAEAILWRGLHYAQVDWRGWGGVGVAANSQCLGAIYAKRALAFKQPAY